MADEVNAWQRAPVMLDVGGVVGRTRIECAPGRGARFATSPATLAREGGNHMLETLCSDLFADAHGEDGYAAGVGRCVQPQQPVFVDRDPTLFRDVLQYLRNGRVADIRALSAPAKRAIRPVFPLQRDAGARREFVFYNLTWQSPFDHWHRPRPRAASTGARLNQACDVVLDEATRLRFRRHAQSHLAGCSNGFASTNTATRRP